MSPDTGSADAAARAEAFASTTLPHSKADFRLQRLAAVFKEDPDPGAIDVFRAWYGENEMSTEEMIAAASKTRVSHFDPADDPVPSDAKLKIKRTYDLALEEGLEDEAAFLRGLKPDDQRRFATLLDKKYLEGSPL